jgi:hypothetical protein
MRLALSLGIALSLTALPGWAVEAQESAVVRVSPAQIEIAEGETATVEIRVDDVDGLYGLDVRLGFDASTVQVVDADPSTGGIQARPGDLLSLDFVVKNEADNDAGTVWFALTQMNPSEAVSGSGVAFSIMLRGTRAGAAPLAITQAKLATRSGEEITASTEDGRIEIRGSTDTSPNPTAPPSALPTATGTPPTPTEPPPQPTIVTPQPTAAGAAVIAATDAPSPTPFPTRRAVATATDASPPTAEPDASGGTSPSEEEATNRTTTTPHPTSHPTSEPTAVSQGEATDDVASAPTSEAASSPTSPPLGASDSATPTAGIRSSGGEREVEPTTITSGNAVTSGADDGTRVALIAAVGLATLGALLILTGVVGVRRRSSCRGRRPWKQSEGDRTP